MYQGEQTCAADGMCQVKCPVGINTGELVKAIRADQLDAASKSAGYGMSQVVFDAHCAVTAALLMAIMWLSCSSSAAFICCQFKLLIDELLEAGCE